MKYTHLDIVNSINARKEGKNTLSWIEKYGIYLCNTSKNIAGSVLVLSIENDDNLSVYDCYFKSKGERTKFCVNKAILVPFAEISSLLEKVKCFERNTQQYWNECFCKGQFDQIVADKKDTLQRSETKASSDPSVDLTMSDFLSTLQNLVKEAIKEIAKTANGWNKYDRIYIASADGRNTYPLVLPLKYTLYNLFETDSKKKYIWGETFREKSKEGGSILKPLSSYDYDWKACQQYFHIGALSRAIGLNVSLELTMNDLMKTDGIRVTFPLETGDDGSYTLPATPVLKECSSGNNTKKISLSGVELNWADLYENVQWDYKAGNHAFKHIKLSICADGCQRLYLMDGDKVLTVITSNGSTVEVENCLNVSNAEPATVVEELEATEEVPSPSVPIVSTKEEEKSVRGDTLEQKKDEAYSKFHLAIAKIHTMLNDKVDEFFRQKHPELGNWCEKYGECIDNDTTKRTWNKEHTVELCNFNCFLKKYRLQIIGREGMPWGKKYSEVQATVVHLAAVRNVHVHNWEKVLGLGYENLCKAFIDMKKLAHNMGSDDIMNMIDTYFTSFKNAFDEELKEHWKNNQSLQEIFKRFEDLQYKN